MTFSKLHLNLECDCLEHAVLDTISNFGLKTNKSTIRDRDFRSKWEKTGKDIDEDCKRKCLYRSVSVSKINAENREEVFTIFKQLFPISPKYKPYLNIFSCQDSAGLVKETPSKKNRYHCSFYKCDTFTIQNIIPVESISLKDV